MSKLRRRYPGAAPFETAQAGQYFGRLRDVQDLYDLILLEKLVVLFGKSGYGKSSLLNAGIIPMLIDPKAPLSRRITPIVIKFAPYIPGVSLTPTEAIKNRLSHDLDNSFRVKFSINTPFSISSRLWYEFKVWQNADPNRKFVLIFDQFEEFFTYPQEQQAQFREQLAELLYTELPQFFRDRWDDLSDFEKEFLSEDLNIRAIFSIREDRLSWLNTLKNDMPAILHKRYELKGLTDEQAKEAIRMPAILPQSISKEGNELEQIFECHSFEYSDLAKDTLLEGLKKDVGGTNFGQTPRLNDRIEAFLLQICCENIESRLIERAKTGEVNKIVGPEDLPRFDRIYEEYYNNKINELPENQRQVARRLIEDELIGFNEATGVIYRLNADGRKLCNSLGIPEDLLKRLIDSFLLRSEPNTTGGFNYEISHDTLVPTVLKAKELRLLEEKHQADILAKTEKERELAKERKKRQFATIVAGFGILLTLIAVSASYYALRLRNEAVIAQVMAEKAQAEAESAKKIAESRLRELQEEKVRNLISIGDSYFQNDEYQLALDEYLKALKEMPDNQNINEKIKSCKSLLNFR